MFIEVYRSRQHSYYLFNKSMKNDIVWCDVKKFLHTHTDFPQVSICLSYHGRRGEPLSRFKSPSFRSELWLTVGREEFHGSSVRVKVLLQKDHYKFH